MSNCNPALSRRACLGAAALGALALGLQPARASRDQADRSGGTIVLLQPAALAPVADSRPLDSIETAIAATEALLAEGQSINLLHIGAMPLGAALPWSIPDAAAAALSPEGPEFRLLAALAKTCEAPVSVECLVHAHAGLPLRRSLIISPRSGLQGLHSQLRCRPGAPDMVCGSAIGTIAALGLPGLATGHASPGADLLIFANQPGRATQSGVRAAIQHRLYCIDKVHSAAKSTWISEASDLPEAIGLIDPSGRHVSAPHATLHGVHIGRMEPAGA